MVVPLRARLAAVDAELLGLSPEQAEDTQLCVFLLHLTTSPWLCLCPPQMLLAGQTKHAPLCALRWA